MRRHCAANVCCCYFARTQIRLHAGSEWPQGIRVDRRGQSFVLDGIITDMRGSLEEMFLMHSLHERKDAWIAQLGEHGERAFLEVRRDAEASQHGDFFPQHPPRGQQCNAVNGILHQWSYKANYLLTSAQLHNVIRAKEKSWQGQYPNYARTEAMKFYLDKPDVADCWPYCT